MRRSTAVRGGIAAGLILVIGLSGLAACSGGGSDAPTPTSSATASASASATADPVADAAALAKVQVSGAAGKAATVKLPSTPFTVTTDVARLISDGTGDTLATGDLLEVHSSWFSGTDGSSLGTTYTAGTPEALVLADSDLPQALLDALVGKKVGVRVVVAITATDSSTGTEVAVVDVASAKKIPSKASGATVAPAASLPTVTRDDTGKPTLKAASGKAPTTLVKQVLIKGTGAAVKSGQTVVVKYTGWLWNGTQFDSSWDRGQTFSIADIGEAQVIDGWNEGLVGQTVGSQVLLVVPPDKGYGSTATGSIPANSTLVFVVDILAAA